MATAFTFASLGDIICQYCVEPKDKIKEKGWDYYRSLNQGFVVGFITNPVSQVYMANIAPRITVNRFLSANTSAKNKVIYENGFKAWAHYLIMAPI